MPKPIDYGPASPAVVHAIEEMRGYMDVNRRLVIIKLLARTIAVDGATAEERWVATRIDHIVTQHFKLRPDAPK